MNKARIADGWEFCMVQGVLFLTSESDPDTQVALSPEALRELLLYLLEQLELQRKRHFVEVLVWEHIREE
jgi:hypothetical protein